MASVSEFRNGMAIRYNGNIWTIVEFQHVKPGKGQAFIRTKLKQLKTGKVVEFGAIKHDLPQGMFSLIGLRGIGAKKAFKLASAFKLNKREDALEKVVAAANANKIRVLPGFGEKSEQLVLEAVSEMKKTKKEKQRMLLINAEKISDRLISYLEKHPEIEDAIAQPERSLSALIILSAFSF